MEEHWRPQWKDYRPGDGMNQSDSGGLSKIQPWNVLVVAALTGSRDRESGCCVFVLSPRMNAEGHD